jgi:hypothetical protein
LAARQNFPPAGGFTIAREAAIALTIEAVRLRTRHSAWRNPRHGRAEETQADRVIDILDDEGTVNLDHREAAWRKEGWDGRYAPDQHLGPAGVTGTARNVGTGPVGAPTTAAKPRPSVPGSATTARTEPVGTDREERIPVAEERLNVGKREVNQGRVRVRSYVVETPVQEQVNLRQEHRENGVSRLGVFRPSL